MPGMVNWSTVAIWMPFAVSVGLTALLSYFLGRADQKNRTAKKAINDRKPWVVVLDHGPFGLEVCSGFASMPSHIVDSCRGMTITLAMESSSREHGSPSCWRSFPVMFIGITSTL